MIRLSTITLFAVFLLSSVHAQSNDEQSRLSLSAGVGTFPAFLGTRYEFSEALIESYINTTIFGTVGISYAKVFSPLGMSVDVSIDAFYGQVSTPQVNPFGLTARMNNEVLFLGLWTKMKVEGALAPFIRMGAGILKSDLREEYSSAWRNFQEKSTRIGGRFWITVPSLPRSTDTSLLRNS